MNERPPEFESNTNPPSGAGSAGMNPPPGADADAGNAGTNPPPSGADMGNAGTNPPPSGAGMGNAGANPPPSGAGMGNTGANPPPGAGMNPPPHAGMGNAGAGAPPGGYRPYFAGAYAYGGPGSGYPPGYPPGAYRPMPKKKMKAWKKALIVIGIILAVIIAFVGFISLTLRAEREATDLPSEAYLARISVVGEIGNSNDPTISSSAGYHHSWTMNTIDRIMEDDNNKGLLLYVDSPGGSVYESDALYLKIMEYKEFTGRPVFVYMGSMAASGGYYISAPADKIYANRNTWTGSIGVIIGTLFDVSEFLEKYGIKATDITSGVNKGMGSYFTPMTEEQRALFQGMVDEAYEQFVGIVADGRGMGVDTVKQIADGRILTAKQALDAGLIDEIALEEDAMESIRDEMGDPDLNITNLDYIGQFSLFGSLVKGLPVPWGFEGLPLGSGTGEQAATDDILSNSVPGDIARVLELTQQDGRVPIKYLYMG
jgi:protease-4